MAGTGCDGFECLRGLTAAEIRNARNSYGVAKPIKLILTNPNYSPVVDGVSLLGQLVDLVSEGRVRPNTPISFNYAEHDAFSFTAGGFKNLQKIPLLAAQSEEIESAIDQSGFSVPSDRVRNYGSHYLN